MFPQPSTGSGAGNADMSKASPVNQDRARRLANLKSKTRCLTCGQYGRWAGDRACQGSNKKGTGNAKSAYFVLTESIPEGSTVDSCAVSAERIRNTSSMDVMPE
eukprot:6458055-Amphidinium_carterae.1